MTWFGGNSRYARNNLRSVDLLNFRKDFSIELNSSLKLLNNKFVKVQSHDLSGIYSSVQELSYACKNRLVTLLIEVFHFNCSQRCFAWL